MAITQRGLYYKDNHMQHVRLVSWGAFVEFFETDCVYGRDDEFSSSLSFDPCLRFKEFSETGKLMQELCDELPSLPRS